MPLFKTCRLGVGHKKNRQRVGRGRAFKVACLTSAPLLFVPALCRSPAFFVQRVVDESGLFPAFMRLMPFGSSGNGFAAKGSDIDLCFQVCGRRGEGSNKSPPFCICITFVQTFCMRMGEVGLFVRA